MLVSLELVVGALAGLIPTFVLSRLALLAVPRRHGLRRIVIANAASWVLCALLAAAFMTVPGELFGLRVAAMLIFPQLCWLIFDAVRHQVTLTGTPDGAPPARRRLI
jgi:hypothetical protein